MGVNRLIASTALSLLSLVAVPYTAMAQIPQPGGYAPSPQPQQGFLKAYDFKPNLYFGAGVQLKVPFEIRTFCPGSIKCLDGYIGYGAAIDAGFRIHYLFALEIGYDFGLLMADKQYYETPIWQGINLKALVYLLAGAQVEIYLTAGGGISLFGDGISPSTTGGGFNAGAGMDIILPKKLVAVDFRVLYEGTVLPRFDPGFFDQSSGFPMGDVDKAFHNALFVRLSLQIRLPIR